ncbi:MAG: DUF2510 domain-containing protein [Acidimicrobiales bacterium]
MFWRVVAIFGALTFIWGGIDVLTTEDCSEVDFGGTRRSSTFACVPEGFGDIDGTLAGVGMTVLGLAIIVLVTWPFVVELFERRHDPWYEKSLDVRMLPSEFADKTTAPAAPQPPPPPPPPVASPPPPPPSPPPLLAQPPPAAPANWYLDPLREKRLRYFDGTAWTQHTAD